MAIDTSMISRAHYFPRFPAGILILIPGFDPPGSPAFNCT
jgi:hypothetical protein